ncbi:hypothetical protein MXB_3926 [Myxobolus squamalis]|nr:hypothetical protein MXB_3926 [Myxobolus squamalis]
MIGEGESQCVIISGESGAGKTVSAKYVMNYVIKVSGGESNVQRVKDIILQSNPLLEAFGNAKTLRNDNSSRFAGGTPEGGRITNFLLEKSRVCHQNEGERNFHFFYQMLAGLEDKKKKELNLTAPEDFPYLSDSKCYTVSGIDDAKDFNEVMQSMEIVGLKKEVQQSIITLIAGILHLSCVTFGEEKNQATVKNLNSFITFFDVLGVNLAAQCFQIDSKGLIKVLISRDMESKWGNTSELIVMEHNKEQAIFALDAISKAVYARIFSYLVDAINHEIDISNSQKSIGILDIYGFEIFSKNGFEQFCINYVNEKLQQIFIELTLKKEQEEYMAEKIKWTPIKFFNNKVVCDLIEGVTYDIDNFCEKNRDVLYNDPIDLMKSSGWFLKYVNY